MEYKGVNIAEKLAKVVRIPLHSYTNQAYKSYTPDELRKLAHIADTTQPAEIEFCFEHSDYNGLPVFVVNFVTEEPETEDEMFERVACAMDDIDKAREEEKRKGAESSCDQQHCTCKSDNETCSDLAREYKEVATKYATEFCLRYFDTDEFWWIGTECNPAIGVADMVIDYESVRYAIDHEIEGSVLFDWYDTASRIAAISERLATPTLQEWAGGYKGPSPEQLYTLENAKKEMDDACHNFNYLLNKTVK